ncbi:Cloroperoxidase [Punctularia strigosozonata HHB-11173 SS5]|uniref:Cloroperoxidase n=1 Tax=Punctularia strigosozonata (strain HHB-11173) TaxID=741275 RepID=UPI0004416C8D|nr:Cloroperoxidase [Punctularia strigosozonata HHB-11173 SS5]EIN08074.1 Cloroperoxidase [Punctularia strigosozonata HHB-11173 SS5]
MQSVAHKILKNLRASIIVFVATLCENILALAHTIALSLGLIRKPLHLQAHPYSPAGKGDARSPCPALNTLANHGYLPHDGREITPLHLIQSLMQGFNLSPFLACFLTFGSFFLMGQWKHMSLSDLCRHNCIEHAASIVHGDPKKYDQDSWAEYAPARMSLRLWEELKEDVKESTDDGFLDLQDVAKARVRREEEDQCPLDKMHAHIARGEIGLVLDIFGGPSRRVPMKWLEDWWMNEEFPSDFHPRRVQTFARTAETGQLVKKEMKRLRKELGPEEGGKA